MPTATMILALLAGFVIAAGVALSLALFVAETFDRLLGGRA